MDESKGKALELSNRMHELETLREQFSDSSKRFPGMKCCVLTWYNPNDDSDDSLFSSADKHGNRRNITLPGEYLCDSETLIYQWKHFPCSPEDLAGSIPTDYDEDERDQILEDCEKSTSWHKKTWLAKRKCENWERVQAISRLIDLVRHMSDYRVWLHDACKINASSRIDLAYIEMLCELEVYEHSDIEGTAAAQIAMDDDCWFLIRWLWLLFVGARNQLASCDTGYGWGLGNYRQTGKWREMRRPYVTKIDDVFLESALFCSRLMNIVHEEKAKAETSSGKPASRTKKWTAKLANEAIQPIIATHGKTPLILTARFLQEQTGCPKSTIGRTKNWNALKNIKEEYKKTQGKMQRKPVRLSGEMLSIAEKGENGAVKLRTNPRKKNTERDE